MRSQVERIRVYMPNNQAYFFISYSQADYQRIKPFLKRFFENKQPYWYDWGVRFGENFNDAIAMKIKYCEAFIVFLSSTSAFSNYVQDEITFARNNYKKVVVVRLDDDINMPDGLQLIIGNLHQLFPSKYNDSPQDIADEIITSVHDKEDSSLISAPLSEYHSMLDNCNQTLAHLARSLGVEDIERDIDTGLFCPIQIEKKDKSGSTIELLSAICSDSGHILLEADGGQGKTYVFLHTMRRLLECDRPCAYIPCHLLVDNSQNKPDLILDKLHYLYLGDTEYTQNAMMQYFRGYRNTPFVLFLDGFNESTNCEELAQNIHKIAAEIPGLQIVVSSRCNDPVFASFKHLSMHGLNTETVSKILREKKQIEYRELNPNMQKLLLTPMFLTLYQSMDSLTEDVDTAAELMDAFRIRTISHVQQNNRAKASLVERVLTEIFPTFALQEYDKWNHNLTFSRKDFETKLCQCSVTASEISFILSFLISNHIIQQDEKEGRCTYRHEHFRDYWVAFALVQYLSKKREENAGILPCRVVAGILLANYSTIVLRYFGELAQVEKQKGLLDDCFSALKKSAILDQSIWESEQNAQVTAKLVNVLLELRNNCIVGYDLSGLNLTRVHLSGVVTSTKHLQCSFHGSLLAEETFFTSTHEGAPRRVEILELNGKKYLVTLSDYDLVISSLTNSCLNKYDHYYHGRLSANDLQIGNLQSSAIIGSVIFAVDSKGDSYIWKFYMDANGTVCCRETEQGHYAKRVLENVKVHKVTKFIENGEPILAALCDGGSIKQFILGDSPETLYSSDEITILHFDKSLPTRRTFTVSSISCAFYWAQSKDGITRIFEYLVDNNITSLICEIQTGELMADLMECAADANDSVLHGTRRNNEAALVLSCISNEKTVLFRIPLPCSNSYQKGVYSQVCWPGEKMYLENKQTYMQRPYNRINALSFHGNEMIAAANDGHIYHFQLKQGQFVPYSRMPSGRIADSRFAIEDAVYIDAHTIAAVCVDRSVFLLDALSLFPLYRLHGCNDGLRKLFSMSDNPIFVTSYDGCILELIRDGDRYRCLNKRALGQWCWSVSRIRDELLAVGYIGGLCVFDIKSDVVLCAKSYPGVKVEYLFADHNTIFAAEHDDNKEIARTRVACYHLEDKNGYTELIEDGSIQELDKKPCYWIESDKRHVYFACNEMHNVNPRIYIFKRSQLLKDEKPEILAVPDVFGRYRDIHLFDQYLIACGPYQSKGDAKTSVAHIWKIRKTKTPVFLGTIGGFNAELVRCAIMSEPQRGGWRLALIDASRNGRIYKYHIDVDAKGHMNSEFIGQIENDRILCDIAFNNAGKLLITNMSGNLYQNEWASGQLVSLFRNRDQMMTFSSNLSDLHKPIDPNSKLGKVLLDFSNRIVPKDKPRRDEL